MKRVGTFVILALLISIFAGVSVFAANTGNLKLEDNYPQNGATGASIRFFVPIRLTPSVARDL